MQSSLVEQVWVSTGTGGETRIVGVAGGVPFSGEGEDVVHPARNTPPMQIAENTLKAVESMYWN